MGETSTNPQHAALNGDARLVDLGREFLDLRRQLATFDEPERQPISHDCRAKQIEEEDWLAKTDPIRDRMFAIACEVVDCPAQSMDGLAAKAEVLLEFAQETGDVVHWLARAVSRDIVHIK